MVPLILLPGTLCTDALWCYQTDNLSDVVDTSIGDLTQDDTLVGMARSILARGPERFALAGLSLGAIVAFEIMRQAPERVLALALLDTTPLPATSKQIVWWHHLVQRADEGEFEQMLQEEWLPPLVHAHHPALLTLVREMAIELGPATFARQIRAQIGRPDSRSLLGEVQCPALVLVGRQDSICPPALHQDMAGALPNAWLSVIEQCGHLSPLEQPAAVADALRAWLMRVSALPPTSPRSDHA